MKNSTIVYSLLCVYALSFPATADTISAEQLVKDIGIRESQIASRDMAGWSRPKKVSILVWEELPDSGIGSREWLLEISDGVEVDIVDASEDDFDTSRLSDSDVYLGWCSTSAISSIRNLQYIHFYSAGIERCVPVLGSMDSVPIATNSAKAASETIAEHSIALMLFLTRNLHIRYSNQLESRWRDESVGISPEISVQGKTMLVLGLGGIGSQIARRADDLGMRVIATRNSSRTGPDYVDYVGLSSEMTELAAQADVVVNALPLTSTTRGIVNAEFFDSMKNGSYYISVGRGATTDTDALIAAMESKKLSGAGLDVTDPEPLPAGHRLWMVPNVIITPHVSSTSDRSTRNTWIIARENLRRYIRGEKLLNLVDLDKGY
jgi:phosphoglycerate dehydrogenase-like enzyme